MAFFEECTAASGHFSAASALALCHAGLEGHRVWPSEYNLRGYTPGFPGPRLAQSSLRRRHCRQPGSPAKGWHVAALGDHHRGVGWGWGRLGEKGRRPFRAARVATGMTRSLWGLRSGSAVLAAGLARGLSGTQGGRSSSVHSAAAVWDPDYYPIKPIVSQQPSIT